MDIVECSICHRQFNNTDDTGVCPNGHQNAWAADEDEYGSDYLRGVTG